jgi:hypothetical protein
MVRASMSWSSSSGEVEKTRSSPLASECRRSRSKAGARRRGGWRSAPCVTGSQLLGRPYRWQSMLLLSSYWRSSGSFTSCANVSMFLIMSSTSA